MSEPEYRFASSAERPTGSFGPYTAAHPRWRRAKILLLMGVISSGLGGCAQGAPSFVLFGAYFPAWMLVAGIGILAAAVARGAMVATGLAETIPFQLLCCTAIGLTAATVFWLVWFAR